MVGIDTAEGGEGRDRLHGGADSDALSGGIHNDRLYGANDDATIDTLDCGDGDRDIAVLRAGDVALGCERVASTRSTSPTDLKRPRAA